jgi:tRNA (guanine6-N2)-methyltransferase
MPPRPTHIANRRSPQPHPGPAPIRLAPDLYAAHTQPGFESILSSEIAARVEGSREAGRRIAPGRAGIVIFSAPRADSLLKLRTAEDLFAVVGYRHGLSLDKAALEGVRIAAREAPHVDHALATRVRLMPGSRSGRRLGFRVVARLEGEHEFRRVDFKRAIERGVAERGDHKWILAEDEQEAEVEFWATMLSGELILAIRLSDERLRHRDYKVAHLPGSLRPAAAAALGWLSEPNDDDVVLDPMCGAGTVLIERAHLGRYRMLLGGDLDAEALDAARSNVGPRYKPIALIPWDAATLPLRAASVTKIVTNLPWGLRHGSHADNRRLYPRMLAEFRRALRPGGLMVLLTAETRLMRELQMRGVIRPSRIYNVTILGAPAALYVCRG